MRSAKSSLATWLPWTGSILLLGAILLFLFWKSFSSGYVHFSNDGPLGQQMAEDNDVAQALTGSWMDLNSIGSRGLAYPPCLSALIRWFLGPVGTSKFLPPIALLFLGCGASYFFRKLDLSPFAALCGALATMLNSTYFSAACWGVGTQEIALGWCCIALGLAMSITPTMHGTERWARAAAAGMAIGQNIFETSDIGAIFSVCIGVFLIWRALFASTPNGAPVVAGRFAQLAVIVIFAFFMAFSNLWDIVHTQFTGVVGMKPDEQTKALHWVQATQWSFPKKETLGLFIPGVFGYRMDSQDGGAYWGTIGSSPVWDEFLKGDRKGRAPDAMIRFSGGGNYGGVLVGVVALWAVLQLFRGAKSPFNKEQSRLMWFWIVVAGFSLLVAYGRFFPLYAFLYKLPGSNYIRNPTKFLGIFSFALVILFAYGIHGLFRCHLQQPEGDAEGLKARLKSWWDKAELFEKTWVMGSLVALVAGVAAWLVYDSSRSTLENYLALVKLGPAAKELATFSIHSVGVFNFFLFASLATVALVQTGVLAGRKAWIGGALLVVVLVGDLGRADKPWIVYWDYNEKYETSGPNPVVQFLKDKPYQHRVVLFPEKVLPALQMNEESAAAEGRLNGVYDIEWNQHLFPYYNIQTLDLVQRPRTPEDIASYEAVFTIWNADSLRNYGRQWELTNTRYILGYVGFLDLMNYQFDPGRARFQVKERFDMDLKPGLVQGTQWSDLTAEVSSNGALAVFEFTGALPRAKLYSDWRVATNDPAVLRDWINQLKPFILPESFGALAGQSTTDLATLKELTTPSFDPWQTVLLARSLPADLGSPRPGADAGSVEIKSYSPKLLQLEAKASLPCVLLLNNKYDPNWHVSVDGQPAELLRCNFIMQGVFLAPGSHTIEFHFRPPQGAFYVSLGAVVLGAALLLFICVAPKPQALEPDPGTTAPVKAPKAPKTN